MKKIPEIVWEFAQPVVEAQKCELWDVEYIKEAGQWYLRLYIDKEGGVSIDDCEKVSRAIDPLLDEYDPIAESYVFEVSSAGAERQLKRPSDFERFMGENVEVKLYSQKFSSKEHVGTLENYEDGAVIINKGGESLRFEKNEVAQVRLRINI